MDRPHVTVTDTDIIVRPLTDVELSELANPPYLDEIGVFTLVFALAWIALIVVVACSL
jgi:hypothetical protein